ncbi:hypothetical protein RHSP_58627 [Rhizobium freirei PRF 81]|uniref:Uncharacterized protein n=1 Tax=Rhizobium freirei PRF 81 TaxID=363754 RepID=N6UTD2_9HYPH|nr:hypothetical protein RHSP_58627 [Rhizobium freirei PRF 81]
MRDKEAERAFRFAGAFRPESIDIRHHHRLLAAAPIVDRVPGLRDGQEMLRTALDRQTLQYDQHRLLRTQAVEVAGHLDHALLGIAQALHAANDECIAAFRPVMYKHEARRAKNGLVAQPNELDGKSTLMASAAAIGKCDKTCICFAASLDSAHVEPLAAPKADHAFAGQDPLGNRKMVDEKCEPLGTAQAVDEKFRQRLLQQFIVRSRKCPCCRKRREEMPPSDRQQRIGSKAKPKEKRTLQAHPQTEGQYSQEQEVAGALRFAWRPRHRSAKSSTGHAAIRRSRDRYVLIHPNTRRILLRRNICAGIVKVASRQGQPFMGRAQTGRSRSG